MEQSNFVEKQIGKYSITMYETEEIGYNFCGRKLVKSKVGNKVYDTHKDEYYTSFECEEGEFSLYVKKGKVGGLCTYNNYFVHFETKDGEDYIFHIPSVSTYTAIRRQFEMSDNDCIAMVNKIVTEEFEDLDIIFDENKPDETNIFNKNTEKIFNAGFNQIGDLIIDEVDGEWDYFTYPTKKDYESIKKEIAGLMAA